MHDLHLRMEPGKGRRVALEEALREAIRAGRLTAGTDLPSSRTLAADLGLARGTVVEAYAQLTAEGYLRTRARSGTQVATAPSTPAPAVAPRPEATTRPRYDLRPITADVGAFPRSAWLTSLRHAVRTAPDDAFRYGAAQGHIQLRTALAAYLGRARGMRTTPDRIVICAGFAHGLTLVGRVLAGRGQTRLAVEDRSLRPSRDSAEHAGLTTIGTPVDRHGLRVDALPAADACLVTPAHQLPLGVALHADRRAELLAWACAGSRLVLEDDYDGEFRYDRQPLGAIQGLSPDQVVYLGTASKSLSPALRLGWLALPEALVGPVVQQRARIDRHSPTLDQLALAHLIETGALDRHLRRMRLRYRHRREVLLEALRTVPGIEVSGVAAGYHLTVLLPAGLAEATMVARLAEAGVAVDPLSFYRGEHAGPPGLVIGYGSATENAYPAALSALASTLGSALR